MWHWTSSIPNQVIANKLFIVIHFSQNSTLVESSKTPTKEILAGLVVALATIPTSISYSTVIGIKPLIGIWNSAILGFISSFIGGAPGSHDYFLIRFAAMLIYSVL
jgi:MFS superfamily sulfate permease-like transporter